MNKFSRDRAQIWTKASTWSSSSSSNVLRVHLPACHLSLFFFFLQPSKIMEKMHLTASVAYRQQFHFRVHFQPNHSMKCGNLRDKRDSIKIRLNATHTHNVMDHLQSNNNKIYWILDCGASDVNWYARRIACSSNINYNAPMYVVLKRSKCNCNAQYQK